MEVEKAAFAATWRDEDTGEILGYTVGDTMCRSPRRPWAMTGTGDKWQFPLPCGECPGCIERQRRDLTKRLATKYPTSKPGRRKCPGKLLAHTAQPASGASIQLWSFRIWAPADLHFYFARKLHRRRNLELEAGMFRLGTDSFVVLARSRDTLPPVLRRLGLRHRVEPVRLSRGRRAWRPLTLGLLVARPVYGEQVKRWYMRGLPKAEKLRWDVVKRAMQKPWRRRTGARVRSGSKIILVPPAIWSMSGDRFKDYRNTTDASFTPEQVIANQRRLAELVAGRAATFELSAPAQPALTREQVRTFYVNMAQRRRARASATPVAALSPSTLLGGGLRSSGHSGVTPPSPDTVVALERWLHSGAPPPLEGRERDYEDWLEECWSDGRTRRAILAERAAAERSNTSNTARMKWEGELDAWLERMKKKLGRG